MIETIKYLNIVNLYENVLRKDNLIDTKTHSEIAIQAIGLNIVEVNELYNELLVKTEDVIKAVKTRQKRNEINRLKEVQESVRLELYNMYRGTGLLNNDKIDLAQLVSAKEVLIAHNLHYENLNECVKHIERNRALMREFNDDLKTVNLNFKIVQYLNEAIKRKDQKMLDKVNMIIEKNFLQSSYIIDDSRMSIESHITSLVLRKIHLTDTHPNFDIKRAIVYFPSIFIVKAILSKTLYRLEKEQQ